MSIVLPIPDDPPIKTEPNELPKLTIHSIVQTSNGINKAKSIAKLKAKTPEDKKEQDDITNSIRQHLGQSLQAARAAKLRKGKRICGLSRADMFEWVRSVFSCSDTDSVDATDDCDAKLTSTKKFLRGVEEFYCLTDSEISQLARLTELRTYSLDEIVVLNELKSGMKCIINRGSPLLMCTCLIDGYYIIMSGLVARSIVINDKIDGNLDPEILEYQDCFGISPAPIDVNDVGAKIESTVIVGKIL